jgi:hypothetical protein
MCGRRQVSFPVDDFNRGVNEFGIAGGWWTRPHNWVSNTAIAFPGIIAVTVMVWTVSLRVVLMLRMQRRTVPPKRPIPSMLVRVVVRAMNAVLTFSCCSGQRNSGKRKIRFFKIH